MGPTYVADYGPSYPQYQGNSGSTSGHSNAHSSANANANANANSGRTEHGYNVPESIPINIPQTIQRPQPTLQQRPIIITQSPPNPIIRQPIQNSNAYSSASANANANANAGRIDHGYRAPIIESIPINVPQNIQRPQPVLQQRPVIMTRPSPNPIPQQPRPIIHSVPELHNSATLPVVIVEGPQQQPINRPGVYHQRRPHYHHPHRPKQQPIEIFVIEDDSTPTQAQGELRYRKMSCSSSLIYLCIYM